MAEPGVRFLLLPEAKLGEEARQWMQEHGGEKIFYDQDLQFALVRLPARQSR
jgi:hypothetical protein